MGLPACLTRLHTRLHVAGMRAHLATRSGLTSPTRRPAARASGRRRTCAGRGRPARRQIARASVRACGLPRACTCRDAWRQRAGAPASSLRPHAFHSPRRGSSLGPPSHLLGARRSSASSALARPSGWACGLPRAHGHAGTHGGSRQAHLQTRSSLTPSARRLDPRASGCRRTCAGRGDPARQQIARPSGRACGLPSTHACMCAYAASAPAARSARTARPQRRRPPAPRRARCTCFARGGRTRQQATDRRRPLRGHPRPESERAGGGPSEKSLTIGDSVGRFGRTKALAPPSIGARRG